jgi:hypothetical protein
MCGTPKKECAGSGTFVNAGLGGNAGSTKTHTSTADAFKCYKRYLIRVEGYEPIGSRELRAPDGSGVLVLPKQSHFGVVLRRGKNQDGKGNRFQSASRRASAGVLIKH